MTEEPEVCTKISEKVKMAGFLEKKGSMLWKRYWFVLEDKLLLYYKSQFEYINLSPCRGSVNMNLVSTVQPRRNSKEPIIHVVSRSQNLVLKAKDRISQEKWLQALLDSMGKQAMGTLRFSLDDLPGETQAMTLPRRLHGGSLDAVWKDPVIPRSRMLDRVLGYEEELDENQNTDPFSSITSSEKERKSQTLDNRKMDSRLEKLRNAIGRRKSSTALAAEPEKASKVRRESFLRKMFKRSPQKTEADTETVESDVDDPLYDTIDHAKTSMELVKAKPFGSKLLLPEGTIEELKEKLRSKESLEKIDMEAKEPPALPPRSFSTSLTTLELTTEVIVHPPPEDAAQDFDESEESELSGHYQVIRKPSNDGPKAADQNLQQELSDAGYEVIDREKAKTTEGEEVPEIVQPPVEAEYQVIYKAKKKKRIAAEGVAKEINDKKIEVAEVSPEVTNKDQQKDTRVEEKRQEDLEAPEKNLSTEIPKEQEDIQNGADLPELPQKTAEEETEQQENPNSVASEQNLSQKPLEEVQESETQHGIDLPVKELPKTTAEEETQQQEKPNRLSSEAPEQNLSHEPLEKAVQEREPQNGIDLPGEDLPKTTAEEVHQQKDLDESFGMETIDLRIVEEGETEQKDNLKRSQEEVQVADENYVAEVPQKGDSTENHAAPFQEMEKGLCELNSLLLRLSEITTAPLAERGGLASWSGGEGELVPPLKLQRSQSDPDYDIPRPHVPLAEVEIDEKDKIPGTGFFTKTEVCTESLNNSLEPDSLEDKKENFDFYS